MRLGSAPKIRRAVVGHGPMSASKASSRLLASVQAHKRWTRWTCDPDGRSPSSQRCSPSGSWSRRAPRRPAGGSGASRHRSCSRSPTATMGTTCCTPFADGVADATRRDGHDRVQGRRPRGRAGVRERDHRRRRGRDLRPRLGRASPVARQGRDKLRRPDRRRSSSTATRSSEPCSRVTSSSRCWPDSTAPASSVSGSCPDRCAESRWQRAAFGHPETFAARLVGIGDSEIAADDVRGARCLDDDHGIGRQAR